MSLFVDTSVWSLALRRDHPPESAELAELTRAIDNRESIFSTGLVLQEILQGARGPKDRVIIIERFMAYALLSPTRADHIEAAELKSHCRRKGIQLDTIDALLAQMCIHRGLTMLTVDRDFHHVAAQSRLKLWRPAARR